MVQFNKLIRVINRRKRNMTVHELRNLLLDYPNIRLCGTQAVDNPFAKKNKVKHFIEVQGSYENIKSLRQVVQFYRPNVETRWYMTAGRLLIKTNEV